MMWGGDVAGDMVGARLVDRGDGHTVDHGRARGCAQSPSEGRRIRRAAGGVLPVYRRSIVTASCNQDEFVAEIGVNRSVCHIRASNPIPGLVPPLLDRFSFGN